MTAVQNGLTTLFSNRQCQLFTGQRFCLGRGTGPPTKEKKKAPFSSEDTDWYCDIPARENVLDWTASFLFGTGTEPPGEQGEATDP